MPDKLYTDLIVLGCELTGDTVMHGMGAWGEAKNASVMLAHVDGPERPILTKLPYISVTTVR